MTHFTIRRFDTTVTKNLTANGVPEPLARVFAARGVKRIEDINYDVSGLIPPNELLNCPQAGQILADAIIKNKKIIFIGDYDCDGATSCAVGIIGLTMFGAKQVDFIIPDREKDGYGLSKSLIDKALEKKADVVVTVDNGICAIEAVAYGKSKGLCIIVTDHHLPAETLPDADCIVNPNQPGDTFASKALAGVGVVFYVLLSTRAALREKGIFTVKDQPNPIVLTDLVALGTVADVVPMDKNNRILITKGLERIRQGKMHDGIAALLNSAGKNSYSLTVQDLGYSIAPRINAAGRLADIACGVNCLISPNIHAANEIAAELDRLNIERQKLQDESQAEAVSQLKDIKVDVSSSICLYNKNWHSGIVGLIASRIKEKHHRPTIAFTYSAEEGCEGMLKGSGRSIKGVHLRDVLAFVDKQNPGLIVKFGGHAMAAGLTIKEHDLDYFKQEFEKAVTQLVSREVFVKSLVTDGELSPQDFNLNLAYEIQRHIWGTDFPEPIFANRFQVVNQRILKDKHLSLDLKIEGSNRPIRAIWFRRKKPLPGYACLSYKLNLSEWQDQKYLQLIIESMEEDK